MHQKLLFLASRIYQRDKVLDLLRQLDNSDRLGKDHTLQASLMVSKGSGKVNEFCSRNRLRNLEATLQQDDYPLFHTLYHLDKANSRLLMSLKHPVNVYPLDTFIYGKGHQSHRHLHQQLLKLMQYKRYNRNLKDR